MGEDDTILQITKEGSNSTHIALIEVKQDNSNNVLMRPHSKPLPVPKPPTPEPMSLESGSSPVQLSSSPVSQSMLDNVKLRSRPHSMREDRKDDKEDNPNTELSQAFGKRFSLIKDTPTDDPKKTSDVSLKKETPKVEVIDTPKPLKTSETRETTMKSNPIGPDVKFVLKKEPLKSTSSVQRSPGSSLERQKPPLHSVEGKITSVDTKESPKSETRETTMKSDSKTTGNIKEGTGVKLESKFSDSKTPQRLAVQKEDYKARREQRSKTLPMSKEVLENKSGPDVTKSMKDTRHWGSQPRPFKEIIPHVEPAKTSVETKPQSNFGRGLKEVKLQEVKSKDLKESKPSTNFVKSVKENKTEEDAKSSELSQSSKENRVQSPGRNVSTALSKRLEPKRLSLVGTSNTSEPSWIAIAKQKQAEEQKENEKDLKNTANNIESKSKDTPVIKDTPKTPPGSVLAGRGKFGASSTEKTNVALVKQPLDKTDNKNRVQDTRPSVESSQPSSIKKNIFEPKTSDKPKEIEKVPAWRSNLSKNKRDQQKDGSSVKIEIIEKSSPPDVKVVEKKEEVCIPGFYSGMFYV